MYRYSYDEMTSKTQTLTLPSNFVKTVDVLVENGEYSSRADYVNTAIRHYYSFILYSLAKYQILREEIKNRPEFIACIKNEKGFIRQTVLGYMKNCDLRDYGDEKTNVLIRLPFKLFEEIEYFVKEYYDSRHDFYRKALEYYTDVSTLNRETMEAYQNCDQDRPLIPWPI